MTAIYFPLLSPNAADADGMLATWYVDEGERVAQGTTIAEATVEMIKLDIASPVSGVIHLLVEEGDAVVQGTPVAHVD